MSRMEKSPGKFEGEPLYVRRFWERIMNSMEDETIYDGDMPVSVFLLASPDPSRRALLVWEDDQGFVSHALMSPEQLETFRSECEAYNNDDNDDDDDSCIVCATCGQEIDEAQAQLSSLQTDGALAQCKDCVSAELTRAFERNYTNDDQKGS